MSIERRLADAILDLESLLAGGEPVASALAKAGAAYEIQPHILGARAATQLGELGTIKARTDRNAAQAKPASLIRSALYRFSMSSDAAITASDVVQWLEHDLGLVLTADEMIMAYKVRNEVFHRAVIREIGNCSPPEANC